ncbi:MAG: glycosyltransferase family 4 protein [Bacteroidales bacterium]|nr:glycosyltransferase family 4 protein [Bacteroidales bacterium]
MIIGFDAKRAYTNKTGLGNYSRNLLLQLFKEYPSHKFLLFTPKKTQLLQVEQYENVNVICPNNIFGKLFKSYWRSFLITEQMNKIKPQIFHGLSNEIPFGINNLNIKTVVTIHDVIFKKFPQWYNKIDTKLYDTKTKYAVKYADLIIAISEQTKKDLIEFYNANEEKIKVVYQNFNPVFYKLLSPQEIEEIKAKYKLPKEYILYVGTIEERKNLALIVEALKIGKINLPLVAIGKKTKYYTKTVEPLINQLSLADKFIHIDQVKNEVLPAIYQGAKIFVYPSFYEGFGIPILEAQASGVPVITSKNGCFKEVAGEAACFIDPSNPYELALSIKRLLTNKELYAKLIEEGRLNSLKFLKNNQSQKLIEIYEKLISN